MTAIAATLLSAAGIYFSFGLGDQWWLSWIALVPVLWFAFGDSHGRIAFAAAFFAFALGSTHALAAYGGVMPNFVIALILAGPSLLFATSVAGARFVYRRLGSLAGTVAFAALWTTCDFATSGTYNGAVMSPAYSQIPAPYLIQSASLFGLWAVTFTLAFVAAGIAISLRTRHALPAVLAVTLFAANAGFGYARIHSAAQTPLMRVGLAGDDSLRESSVDTQAAADKVVAAYAGAIRKLTANGARLIVIPEKVAFLKPAWRQEIAGRLAALSRETQATIVMGFDERGPDRLNEALVFTPERAEPLVYLKRRFVQVLEDGYKTGPGGFVLPDRTGVAICKDMDYPAMLRADSRTGRPTLLAVPAWDFGPDGLAHAEPAIMRGVENGFALARAGRDGLLTMTDAYGRMLAMTPTSDFGMVTVAGDLPRGPGETLYKHIGNAFAWFSALLSAVLLGLALAKRRSSRV